MKKPNIIAPFIEIRLHTRTSGTESL